jgi:hypothetical protein
MADQVRRVEYCYVEVADKPGEGVRVLVTLKEAGVNLLSFTAFPNGSGKVQIDVAAQDAEGVARALKGAGFTVSARKPALFVTGSDRAGAGAEVLRKLAAAGVNVRAANAAAAQGGYGMILWFAPSDFAAAAKALGA